MQNKKIVLDTNVLISSLSRRGKYFPIWRGFQEGKYTLDSHFDVLQSVDFPILLVLKLKEFLEKIQNNSL
jgi:predicted nucleic acid-binding protein